MYPQVIFFATLVVLGSVYSLPLEDKIEPVELFHHCVGPINDEIDPDKSPVLLLHGILGSHRNYEGVDQLIADRTKRKVCSVDLRNHADSPWNNRSDIAAFAVDIGHFLDMQNIKKVNIIGESLGGKIALHYTLNNPERVDSLIVEEMGPNKIQTFVFMGFKFFVRFLKKLIDSQPKDMTEDGAKKWASEKLKDLVKQAEVYEKIPKDLEKFLELRQVNGKWQLKHNLDLLYESVDKPKELWTESKSLYTGPTLFMYGTQSALKVGEQEEEILKLFPNAKLIPFEGAGHLIHKLHREFDDITVKFLNGIN